VSYIDEIGILIVNPPDRMVVGGAKPMTTRRFPAPWSAEVQPNYYVVRDADGQQIAYIYFENEPGHRNS
jgi:hypothetical protein